MQKTLSTSENWNFDKEFFKTVVSQGKETLNSNNLSRRKRQSLRIDIETFERFIQGDFDFKFSESYRISLPKNIDKLKEYILTKMAKQYKTLGKELIIWLIALSEENIFNIESYGNNNISELTIDEQAELTIKNYEKNSHKYLEIVKKIICDKSIKQIQAAIDVGSYCHHDSITGQSFVIVDQEGEACIFNHEIQHAVEMLYKYKTNPLFCELGPIYHELLFNDELYKSQGYLENGDYYFRIEEFDILLKSISEYLQVVLLFANKNFDISTNEFLNTFIDIEKIDPVLLEEYLREEVASSEKIEDMNYIFSFLKAIELKEKNNNQTEFLEHYIDRKKFNFNIPKDNFKVYERYIEEISQKTRKRIKIYKP